MSDMNDSLFVIIGADDLTEVEVEQILVGGVGYDNAVADSGRGIVDSVDETAKAEDDD